MRIVTRGLRPPPKPGGPLPKLPNVASRVLLREEMGWSQREAAEELGVSTVTFWRWERGYSDPEPGHLRAYYELLYEWQEAIRGE